MSKSKKGNIIYKILATDFKSEMMQEQARPLYTEVGKMAQERTKISYLDQTLRGNERHHTNVKGQTWSWEDPNSST